MRCGWLLLPWIAAAAMPSRLQLLGELVGAVLGAGEDERLVDRAGAHEVAEQLALALAVDRVDDLRR